MPPQTADKFPLLDYLDSLVDELRGLATKAIKGDDPDAVHDARVATRRIKAGIELLEVCLSGKRRRPLEKITRSLRRRLGEVRDLDVMLGHLGEMKTPRHAAAVEWISRTLNDARDDAAARAASALPPSKVLARLGTWWGLRQDVLAARDAVHTLLAESIHLQLDAFVEQMERKGDPHFLRIAAKSLRYTIEMAREEKLPLPRPVVSQFKRIQDALGLWHDYVVLAERLMEESAGQMLAHHNVDLQQAVLSLATALLNRSRHQLSRVAKLWQSHNQELIRQIKLSLPLTTDAPLPPTVPPPAPPPEAQPTLYQIEEKI